MLTILKYTYVQWYYSLLFANKRSKISLSNEQDRKENKSIIHLCKNLLCDLSGDKSNTAKQMLNVLNHRAETDIGNTIYYAV